MTGPEIFEITPNELRLINEFVESDDEVILWVVPDRDFDEEPLYRHIMQHNREINNLVKMGFLDNVTVKYKERIEHARLLNEGRVFRAFSITKIAQYMFADQMFAGQYLN